MYCGQKHTQVIPHLRKFRVDFGATYTNSYCIRIRNIQFTVSPAFIYLPQLFVLYDHYPIHQSHGSSVVISSINCVCICKGIGRIFPFDTFRGQVLVYYLRFFGSGSAFFFICIVLAHHQYQ